MSCGEGPTDPLRTPASITVVSGDLQSGSVGGDLPVPLQVRVDDSNGRPIAGQIVNFVVLSGGGSVFAGVANTNADGVAREIWTLGPVARDTQVVEARAVSPTSGAPLVFARFRAVASPGPATRLVVTAITAPPSAYALLSPALQVRVTDQYLNTVPVDGMSVSLSITGDSTSGPVALGGNVTAATAAGVARFDSVRVLGATQGVRVRAVATGLTEGTSNRFDVSAPVATDLRFSRDSIVVEGENVSVEAVARIADGTELPRALIRWTSADTSSFRVSTQGILSPVASGPPAMLVAEVGALRRQIPVRVRGGYGIVTVTDGSLPLSGLDVWLSASGRQPTRQVTDTAGRAIFRGTPAGTHQVTLDALPRGFEVPNPQSMPVPTDGPGIAEFRGRFLPASLAGRVHSWGRPVANTRVTLAGPVTRELVTDALGRFAADSVPRGRYALSVAPVDGVRFPSISSLVQLESGVNLHEFAGEPLAISWSDVSAGQDHICALDMEGVAYCWGDNEWGQLGDGTLLDRRSPYAVATNLRFESVESGWLHSCAVTRGRTQVWCWGAEGNGALNRGWSNEIRTVPLLSYEAPGIVQVEGGSRHVCVLNSQGQVTCWGNIDFPVIAAPQSPNDTSALRPNARILQAPPLARISSGFDASCGVTPDAVAYCWGNHEGGKLGDSTATYGSIVRVKGNVRWANVVVGTWRHSCGISVSGIAYCWGSNSHGQLGDGTQLDRLTPTQTAGGRTVTQLTMSHSASCALGAFAQPFCWGMNSRGELGLSPTGARVLTPTLMPTELRFSKLSFGSYATCGISIERSLYCWGSLLEFTGRPVFQGPSPVRIGPN